MERPEPVLRLLLRVFPAPFRQRFGDDLIEVATDRLAAARRRGRLAWLQAWARTAADLAAQGLAERRTTGRIHRRPRMCHAVLQDVRYAIRGFRRRPGFTAAALVTLALGIGANTAIFSAVYAVMLRPLPYPGGEDIVLVYATYRKYDFDHGVVNPADYDYIETRESSFSAMSIVTRSSVTLTGAGTPERLRYAGVMPSFFDVMRTSPALGRRFTEDEARTSAHVAIISYALWTSRFGQRPDILTQTAMFDDEPWTIVGVMPERFAYPANVQFWRPMTLTPADRANLGAFYLGVIARLAPGVSAAVAQAELDRFGAELEAAYPRRRADRGFHVTTLRKDLGLNASEGLTLLQGVVLFVLLIACANVANLLLAQGAGRSREFGVRAAVGASRGRLVRQALIESATLAVIGAALGATLAVWGVRALVAMTPAYLLPAPEAIGVSWPVLAVTAAAALATGLLFGLGPALATSRPSLSAVMGDGGRAVSSGLGWSRRQWLRASLVAGEVALALILLTGAGLLVRSFSHLLSQAPGFRADGLLTAQVTLPARRYPDADAKYLFWSDVTSRLRATPGVQMVAGSTALPFSLMEWQTGFRVVGREDTPNEGAGIRTVTPGYFRTLGIPLLQGRAFTAGDTPASTPVAIVSDAFAQKYLPGLDPIGQRLRLDAPDPVTIVGVVGATRHLSLEEPLRPEIYRPLSQDRDRTTLLLAIRTGGDPRALAGPMRDVVEDIDASLPVSNIATMDDLIANKRAERRFYMTLLTLFSCLAIALAVTGVYGVMAYVVTHSRREIAIRLALGAAPGTVKAAVVRQGLAVVAVGTAAGLLGARWLSGLVQAQLFNTAPTDIATYLTSAVLLTAAATLACWIAVSRASSVSPLEALRETSTPS